MKQLEAIAEASRRYGRDPQHVFGGGGNTSFKTATHLFIKPSGVELATIAPEQFVKMSRAAIRRVYECQPPADPKAREALIKQVMAAAVCPDSQGRPSVEAPLHELIPEPFVVHVHSVLVNGMTCARQGAAVCARLFPEALWMDYVDPGYTLATQIKLRLTRCTQERGVSPRVIILQNHGIFVSGDSIREVDETYARILGRLQAEYARAGVSPIVAVTPPDLATVRRLAPPLRTWLCRGSSRAVIHTAGWFEPVAGPLSPDHIVYAKSAAYRGEPTAAGLARFARAKGYAPAVVAVKNRATFAVAPNLRSARVVLEAARNARQVLQLTAAFGGPRWLSRRERTFIEEWEVESYRRQINEGAAGARRLAGKLMLITGGAQGFGFAIAEAMATAGATVILADLNAKGAAAMAAQLCTRCGPDAALPLTVDVSNEDSVRAMADAVACAGGGLDVLIANAGVLRAAPVTRLSKADWDLVNAVNYTGYFLCVKHLAPLLAGQNVAGNQAWTDIIQIGSKSALQGSNRNAAYAGSKFGGLGLTQSFALELLEHRIKVNSICPGNFFDGPLWSDPKQGLFVQYLHSGKVPGAKTIADVRAAYEAKVPMGRGCEPRDVALAITYVIEQQYETGQAIPVTGGQVMLR